MSYSAIKTSQPKQINLINQKKKSFSVNSSLAQVVLFTILQRINSFWFNRFQN